MSDNIQSMLNEARQWLKEHVAKQYPGLGLAATLSIAANQHCAVFQAQRMMDAAAASGDLAATKQSARAWCLAWRAALKAYVPPVTTHETLQEAPQATLPLTDVPQ